jgi:hypothetical protein
VYLENSDSTQKQDPRLQGTTEVADIYTKACFTPDARSYIGKDLWEICIGDSSIRISAIVTAITM